MAKESMAARSLHTRLVGVLAQVPEGDLEALVATLARWTHSHLDSLGVAAEVYGLRQLSALDVSQFPVAKADVDPLVTLRRFRDVKPSSLDALAMRIRDVLWQTIVLQTQRRCPRCSTDDLRLLKSAQNGATIRMCDFCGYTESEPPGWTPGERYEPMTTQELVERGLLTLA